MPQINTTTKDARRKLKQRHEPYWRQINKRLSLGYRKGIKSSTWIGRFYNGKYQKKQLGKADDGPLEANDTDILSYAQALKAVQHWADHKETPEDRQRRQRAIQAKYTVKQAIEDYLRHYEIENAPKPSTLKSTKQTINKHIIQKLGEYAVSDLTVKVIKDWRDDIAQPNLGKIENELQPREISRKRKSTANRILTILKAALNYAWSIRSDIPSDEAWKKVKAFKRVDKGKVRPLTTAEAVRLINASEVDFRKLIRASLMTGIRYGEATNLKIKDFMTDVGKIVATDTKNGKSRVIPLTDEGVEFFKQEITGKLGEELVFKRQDGEPWGKSHQHRRMKAACIKAKITPLATFHNLRDTYASILAQNGTPMRALADLLGHSDTRITEKHYAKFQDDYITKTLRENLPSFGLIERDNVEVL